MRGRDKAAPVIYFERFESDYKIGDVVSARDRASGKKMSGTFTLMGQFQRGPHDGWWALRKWGSGERYREETKPVLDTEIIEWLDFNKRVVQPTRVEVTW